MIYQYGSIAIVSAENAKAIIDIEREGSKFFKEKKMKEVSVESETKSAVIDLIEALQKDATIESQSTPQVIDENLRYIILHYFEKNRIVRTKTKLINDIVILGYNEELVESLVDLMVQEGLIQYSPSDPRGWFLAYQE